MRYTYKDVVVSRLDIMPLKLNAGTKSFHPDSRFVH